LPRPTVVIPVFDAFEALGPCLGAVEKTAPQARVIVIDDASRDNRVTTLLDSWATRSDHHELVRFRENQGFVRAANHGLAACPGDVILLNSDTRVTSGWFDALSRCLDSDPQIATATPWTNNGEVASFPGFCRANPVPPDPEALARAAAASKGPGYPDLPTAVGFCMAIARRAIEAIGLFDEAAFGRGYGEENDFSLRAAAAGMRNVLCDDAYVVHLGGQSFEPLGLRPDEHSMQRLLRKHPDYLATVSAFIEADPLAGRRARFLNALEAAQSALG